LLFGDFAQCRLNRISLGLRIEHLTGSNPRSLSFLDEVFQHISLRVDVFLDFHKLCFVCFCVRATRPAAIRDVLNNIRISHGFDNCDCFVLVRQFQGDADEVCIGDDLDLQFLAKFVTGILKPLDRGQVHHKRIGQSRLEYRVGRDHIDLSPEVIQIVRFNAVPFQRGEYVGLCWIDLQETGCHVGWFDECVNEIDQWNGNQKPEYPDLPPSPGHPTQQPRRLAFR
jgi:hypothetical protein